MTNAAVMDPCYGSTWVHKEGIQSHTVDPCFYNICSEELLMHLFFLCAIGQGPGPL